MKRFIIAVLAMPMLLAGCGQQTTMKAVVKPSQQTVQIPKATEIQHMYVVAGLNAMSYTPKNQPQTVAQIEKWLMKAKPVSVQLPPPPNQSTTTNANTNPAVLELQLSSKQQVSISPTYYMAGHSQELNQLYHFVDGVISYQVENKTVYFKDSELYNWLKNNQWEQQFNTK